jgi:hypothetical protein
MERHNLVLPFFQWRFDTDDRRAIEKNLADKINYLSKTSKEDLETLKSKVKTYTEKLSSAHLRDENFSSRLDWGGLRYFAVIAGAPIFLAGYLSNLIPFIVPKYVCDKLIRDRRHYSSVYVSSGTVLYLIYFPLLVLLAVIFAGWKGFILALLIPPSGYLALYYQEIFRERVHTLIFNIKSITNKNLIADLASKRKEIQDILEHIKVS